MSYVVAYKLLNDVEIEGTSKLWAAWTEWIVKMNSARL